MSSSIFSTKERKQYRDTLSRLVEVLQYLSKHNNVSKWRISCLLHTSTTSIDNIIDAAERHDLVYATGKRYSLTERGKSFLEVLSA